ncbi:MAG: hypothetical protein ACOX61_06460 [Brooklawnia sp.]
MLSRLQNLTELGQAAPGLSTAGIEERLEAIADAQLMMTSMRAAHSATLDALRAAATASELERVASLTTALGLAELLRQAAQA